MVAFMSAIADCEIQRVVRCGHQETVRQALALALNAESA